MKRFKRKPRTKSEYLGFDGAHQFGKPLPWSETPATKKLAKRLKNKECLGCGKTECKCKRKGFYEQRN
jgi:hypothetical protein